MDEDKIIQERKRKIINFFRSNPNLIFYILLAALVILGLSIRYLPLSDHGGKPGLWDSTLKDYTLGPDLDPYLFLRYAKTIIENGSLPEIDNMRNVPLGFDTTTELQMVSYMIVLTHKIINLFGTYSINYSGAFMPVWIFGLTIIAFFLFVREIFSRKDKKSLISANIIALISSFFMIILPGFLSRTVAGIPEKESVAFFFMFASLYLFLKSWKTERNIKSYILAIVAGIFTGLMGLTWGGVTYLFVTIAFYCFFIFILGKVDLRETISYSLWFISSLLILFVFTNRFSIMNFISGLDTGMAFGMFGVIILHQIIWKTSIKKILRLEKLNLPKTILTLLIVIILGLLALFIINPELIFQKIRDLYGMLIRPVTGRWNTTVAENAQPYFTSWLSGFGFWFFLTFIIGSIILFKNVFPKIEKKHAILLSGFFALFIAGIMLSRFSSGAPILNGESLISKLFYFGSALLWFGSIVYLYIQYHKEKKYSFELLEQEYLFLIILFVLTLFTARSAVRLIMVLIPIAPIFFSYLLTSISYKFLDKTNKNRLIFGILTLIVLIIGFVSAFGIPLKSGNYGFYQQIRAESYSFVPASYYHIQWQNAMAWVRENTPEDAVFAHWWDYGYWLQSIGNRATVTDGGNAIVWWNYLTGRHVLTGDNQRDSLNFLWNHKADYLLIDSSDIGKYGAFSRIGSDKDFDRFSFGPLIFLSDKSQIKETKNGISRVYSGGSCVDEDIVYYQNNTKIFLPGFSYTESNGDAVCHSYVIGVILDIVSNNSEKIEQPSAVFVDLASNQQYKIPIRYVYYKGELVDYEKGLEAAVYIIEKLDSNSQGVTYDDTGAIIYISPRILRTFLGQVYLLNNSFNNFKNFELVHSEENVIINSVNSQSQTELGEFVYYQGLLGPIKIWTIKYEGTEKENPEYLIKTPPERIDWEF
jgi:asparagine N-glycosylation enzyme membrane subunit Stt3